MKRSAIKIATILLALAVSALMAVACGEETSELIGILKSNGFNVGAESDERLVFIGAPQDTSVKVNGHDVLIYRFPDRDGLREGVIAIEDIIRAGTGLWGYDPAEPRARPTMSAACTSSTSATIPTRTGSGRRWTRTSSTRKLRKTKSSQFAVRLLNYERWFDPSTGSG